MAVKTTVYTEEYSKGRTRSPSRLLCTHVPVTQEKRGVMWGAGWFVLSSSEVWFCEWVVGFGASFVWVFSFVCFFEKVREGI